ncbi:hypothetical protein DVH24_023778, partial [Malus domestica]
TTIFYSRGKEKDPLRTLGIVWYVGRDGIEWDETFRLMFVLGKFSFCLNSWNDSFHIRGIQNYNISVSFLFLFVSIRGHLCFLFIPSCPVPSHFVPSCLLTKRYLSVQSLLIKQSGPYKLNPTVSINSFFWPTTHNRRP